MHIKYNLNFKYSDGRNEEIKTEIEFPSQSFKEFASLMLHDRISTQANSCSSVTGQLLIGNDNGSQLINANIKNKIELQDVLSKIKQLQNPGNSNTDNNNKGLTWGYKSVLVVAGCAAAYYAYSKLKNRKF